MYFDPLTSWLVALIADGISISSEYASNSKISERYGEYGRKISADVNENILRIKRRGYSSAEYALESIKDIINQAKDSYEFRKGYAKLEITAESYEYMIQLCEECRKNYAEKYRTYSQRYQKRKSNGESERDLMGLRETIQEYNSKAIAYQSVLEWARIGREKAIREDEERARELARRDSDGVIVLKSVFTVGLCIFGFVVAFNTDGLIGPLALIGAVICGTSIMGVKFDKAKSKNAKVIKPKTKRVVKYEPLDVENYVSSEWKDRVEPVRCSKCSAIYLNDMEVCPSCGSVAQESDS